MLHRPTLVQVRALFQLSIAEAATRPGVPQSLPAEEATTASALIELGLVQPRGRKYLITADGQAFLDTTYPQLRHALLARNYWQACAARRMDLLRQMVDLLHTLQSTFGTQIDAHLREPLACAEQELRGGMP